MAGAPDRENGGLPRGSPVRIMHACMHACTNLCMARASRRPHRKPAPFELSSLPSPKCPRSDALCMQVRSTVQAAVRDNHIYMPLHDV